MAPTKVGKYTVAKAVGTRGEGLYLGESGSRKVIIRVPTESHAETGEEARKIAALSHAGIAPQEVGLFDEQVFLASEVGAFPSLDGWISSSHSQSDQLGVIETLSEALGYIHEQGVLHRALKPSNVLVTSSGCRLMNFGLASSATSLGEDAAVYGAPEVLEGMPDTSQSDIYSAGVVFYEVLAGRREEARDGRVPKPLREVRPDISRDIADAVMACRERSPDWRPKDLTYLLEVVRRERGSSAASAPRAQAPRAAAKPQAAPAQARPAASPTFATRRPARSPVPILVGIAVVLVGGIAGWFLTRTPQGGGASTPPPATSLQARPPVTTAEAAPATPAPSPSAKLGATEPQRPTPPPTTVAAAPQTPAPIPSLEPRTQTPRPPVTTLAAAVATPLPVTATAPPPTTLARVEESASSEALGPAVLTAVSPPAVKRGGRTLVDIRGTGLRTGLSPSLTKGKAAADGVRVVSQRFVNPTLVQVFFEVDAAAATGTYMISLADSSGASNALRLEIR